MLPGEFGRLVDLGLRYFVSVRAHHSDSGVVDAQHDAGRLGAILVEELSKHEDDELHRREVVVVKEHAIHRRALRLRALLYDDSSFLPGFSISVRHTEWKDIVAFRAAARVDPKALPHYGFPMARHPNINLDHRDLRRDEFWRKIPAYKDVDTETFLDHRWQAKNSITKPKKLVAAVQELASAEFIADVEAGFARSPMSVRVSPYLLSLIDWEDPYRDPLRVQFIPVGTRLLSDHPMLTLDSLAEQRDSPVPGLTHRYPDKALFLVLDTCPVYCRFCTRSYAVGIDTEEVEKVQLKVNRERWAKVFDYIRDTPYLEDIVVSGGDAYQLKARQLDELAEGLLSIPHLRRIRIATKGPAIMPMKLLTDHEWVDALTRMVDRGRKQGVHVCLHTHFNHPNEVTGISHDALNVLFERGITVRNQAVLQRNVNDSEETMRLLVRRLSEINVHPYYVYVHDLVSGVEDLRTTVASAIKIEKAVRGATAGFNSPVFVVDAPGGGGKRDVHSFEYYNRETGVSVYRSPNVDSDAFYFYCDPLDLLPDVGRARWSDPGQHKLIIEEAREAATTVRNILNRDQVRLPDNVEAGRFAQP